MRIFSAFLVSCTVLSGAAEAAVDVTFRAPEDFRDAKNARGSYAETLEVIAEHLRELGTRYLSPEQTLRVEILDIDLAGEIERWHGPDDIRFMRSVTWPRISLRYSLEGPNGVAQRGEEQVADMEYLLRPDYPGNVLTREKVMLTRWFQSRFARR